MHRQCFLFALTLGLTSACGSSETETLRGTSSVALAFDHQVLTASDAADNDGFGHALAVNGDTALIGAWETTTGAVYIFERQATGWVETGKVLPSDSTSYFGQGVAMDGELAAIGGLKGVYLLSRNLGGANAWGEVKKLVPSDGVYLGAKSVGISGNTIVAGALTSHAAYIFERDQDGPDNWGEVRRLEASDLHKYFGTSVSISGDTVVVGALGGFDAGAAYVFERNQGGANAWGEVKKLLPSDSGGQDSFGWSVAVSGDVAFVVTNDGAAYVFHRDHGGAGNWGEVAKLGEEGLFYGYNHVALANNVALLGSGSKAYVRARNEGGDDQWGLVATVEAPSGGLGSKFGEAVALSGVHYLVGAQDLDAGGTERGGVFAFFADEDLGTGGGSSGSGGSAGGSGTSGSAGVSGNTGFGGFAAGAGAAGMAGANVQPGGSQTGGGCGCRASGSVDGRPLVVLVWCVGWIALARRRFRASRDAHA